MNGHGQLELPAGTAQLLREVRKQFLHVPCQEARKISKKSFQNPPKSSLGVPKIEAGASKIEPGALQDAVF